MHTFESKSVVAERAGGSSSLLSLGQPASNDCRVKILGCSDFTHSIRSSNIMPCCGLADQWLRYLFLIARIRHYIYAFKFCRAGLPVYP